MARTSRGKMAGDPFREYLDRFPAARVLVLGDVMVDEYVWGTVSRISPEAPVPVVAVRGESVKVGGAAGSALRSSVTSRKVTEGSPRTGTNSRAPAASGRCTRAAPEMKAPVVATAFTKGFWPLMCFGLFLASLMSSGLHGPG